ncbi:MAG: mechanosensitive ion channel family protein, partial [Chloroflexota bacterium]
MDGYFGNLAAQLGAFLPSLLAALAIFIVGWIVALLASKAIGGLLQRTSIDDRIANMLSGSENPRPEQVKIEKWIAGAVFWLILFITIVIVLNTLQLQAVSGPFGALLTQILTFLPKLLSAGVLLLVAWIIASVARLLVTRLVSASGLTRRATETAEVRPQDRVTIGQSLGNIVYWLVFLLFLPAVLDALDLQGILAPVQSMVNEILGVLPNLLAAGLILAAGWL